MRWFGRGCFECEQCGEFPDLRDPALATAPPDPISTKLPALACRNQPVGRACCW
jgi:hypothetical protein